METEITQRPSSFEGGVEDDLAAASLLARSAGGDMPGRSTNGETISLGMVVAYKGTLSMRGDSEFVGVVTRVSESECVMLILAPGKTWAPGASAFREVRAPMSAVRRLRSKYSIGQRAIFRVREEEHAETLGWGFRAVPVVRQETIFDEETETMKGKIVRSPGVETKPPVHRGSIYHKEMIHFAAMVIRPYEDESVDLLLFVPQRPEPFLVRGVREGEGAGAFSLVD